VGEVIGLASTLSAPPLAEQSAAPRRLQSLLIRGGGAPDVLCPLSPAGAMVQTRQLRRPKEQAQSTWGRVLPPLRRRVEAK
jgi:hypothetical protein